MFENITKFFKRFSKDNKESKDTAKERLQLVLMQDRANVSADFLELMKQEIIEVIKKYVDVDENLIDVTLTNTLNKDGTTGAPALYANIPIISLKDETKKLNIERKKAEDVSKKEENIANEVEEEKEEVNTEIEEKENVEESKEEQVVEEIKTETDEEENKEDSKSDNE